MRTALLNENRSERGYSPLSESGYADFRERIQEADRINSLTVEKAGKGSRSFQDSIVKAIAEARIDTMRLDQAGAKVLVLEPCLRRGRLLAGTPSYDSQGRKK